MFLYSGFLYATVRFLPFLITFNLTVVVVVVVFSRGKTASQTSLVCFDLVH